MGTPPVGGMDPVPATHAPTFKAVYNEVLVVQGCISGCHTDTGLDNLGDPATARATLLAATAHGPGCNAGQMMVVPNNPDQSLLVQKLRPNPPCGGQMPPGASLTPEEIDQVAMWIQLGAMDN